MGSAGWRESILTDTTGKVFHVDLPQYHLHGRSLLTCLQIKCRRPYSQLDCRLIVIYIRGTELTKKKSKTRKVCCFHTILFYLNLGTRVKKSRSYCCLSLWLIINNTILDLKFNIEEVIFLMAFTFLLLVMCCHLPVLQFATSFVFTCLPVICTIDAWLCNSVGPVGLKRWTGGSRQNAF